MAEYDRAIATATRLIGQKGRPAELIPPAGAVDALKPWLGQSEGAGIPCMIFMGSDSAEGAQHKGIALLAASADYAPTSAWKVLDSGSTWNIGKVSVLAPGLQTILYRVEVAR